MRRAFLATPQGAGQLDLARMIDFFESFWRKLQFSG